MTPARRVVAGVEHPLTDIYPVRTFPANPALSDREKFIAVLGNSRRDVSEAIVLLCGEDVEPRLETAYRVKSTCGGHVVLTGGVHAPPRLHDASSLAPRLLGGGVAYNDITIDGLAMNTREQAVNVVALAAGKGWKRLAIVASNYHQYRAFLTFLKALQQSGQTETIQLINVPVTHTKWSEKPAGCDMDRLALLSLEAEKIERYVEDVASYAEGLEYLKWWEGK